MGALKCQNKVVGQSREQDEFDEEDMYAARTIAAAAAQALDQIRYFEATRQILNKANSSATLRDILVETIETGKTLLGAARGDVALLGRSDARSDY